MATRLTFRSGKGAWLTRPEPDPLAERVLAHFDGLCLVIAAFGNLFGLIADKIIGALRNR